MLTDKIIVGTAESPLHLRADPDLTGAWISSKSRWCDARWVFDNPTPGAHSSSSIIYWSVLLPDGRFLTDPEHRILLGWLRRFVWSLLAAPGNSVSLAPGSMGDLSVGVRRFARWLVSRGYGWPKELDNAAIDSFVSDLPSLLLEDDDSDDEHELSFSAVRSALRVPVLLWQQGEALVATGIEPMPAEPFDGKSAKEIAASITKNVAGWIKPLPDEVAIPILNRAAWFLGGPSEDVLRLQSECLQAWSAPPRRRIYKGQSGQLGLGTRKECQLAAAKAFRFSILPGETVPWHSPLEQRVEKNKETRTTMQQVRFLVQALRDAAVIILQSTGGMRISEICGLPAGVNLETGLPICVRTEQSVTGLNELFICRTLLAKTEETPRDQDWILGMRPNGNTDLPLAVRALIVLDRLLAPYRALLGSDRLLVWFSAEQGLSKSAAGVAPVNAASLRRGIRCFIADWVDLSGLPNESAHKVEDNDLVPWRKSKGRIIKTHMFRKMWASFALNVDPRLLPVIQMQFHHLNQVMTEGGYIGRNRLQVAPLSSVQAQQTNLLMFEMAQGKSVAAGRMGEQLEQHIGELRERIQGKPMGNAWQETVRFVNEYDLRLWFAPHGKCLPLVPPAMRCHEIAATTSWLNREPNYATRDPSVCAGCSCFVLDARHKGFWEDRYVHNWLSYRQSELMGIPGKFRVIRERAYQAKALLGRIGADTAPLDDQVEAQLKKMGHAA